MAPMRDSNPRLPARQAGTLTTELMRQMEKQIEVPVTGSGAAQSLRPVSVLADGQRENVDGGVVCGIRTRVAEMKARRP
jgi:hypothetical protein